MTNYNDGKWHGWNGGACPVHPQTRVEGLEENGARWEAEACDCDWPSFRGAFRVIKEYREPREWWVSAGRVWDTREDAANNGAVGDKPIHVREVLE